ncbi:hypothetical protein [Variovorax sp. R-27]|uniref:hypothetical protein n=1 Tax=Variovorax sp. R-27 TaxID=3404058 RepID=UPI003CF6F24F
MKFAGNAKTSISGLRIHHLYRLMTSFDWLWDWRTLIALAVCDVALLAMFLAWDARRLAFLLARRCIVEHELPRERKRLRVGVSLEDRGVFPRESPESGI